MGPPSTVKAPFTWTGPSKRAAKPAAGRWRTARCSCPRRRSRRCCYWSCPARPRCRWRRRRSRCRCSCCARWPRSSWMRWRRARTGGEPATRDAGGGLPSTPTLPFEAPCTPTPELDWPSTPIPVPAAKPVSWRCRGRRRSALRRARRCPRRAFARTRRPGLQSGREGGLGTGSIHPGPGPVPGQSVDPSVVVGASPGPAGEDARHPGGGDPARQAGLRAQGPQRDVAGAQAVRDGEAERAIAPGRTHQPRLVGGLFVLLSLLPMVSAAPLPAACATRSPARVNTPATIAAIPASIPRRTTRPASGPVARPASCPLCWPCPGRTGGMMPERRRAVNALRYLAPASRALCGAGCLSQRRAVAELRRRRAVRLLTRLTGCASSGMLGSRRAAWARRV